MRIVLRPPFLDLMEVHVGNPEVAGSILHLFHQLINWLAFKELFDLKGK